MMDVFYDTHYTFEFSIIEHMTYENDEKNGIKYNDHIFTTFEKDLFKVLFSIIEWKNPFFEIYNKC
jgi:hypothetical protein